ncbi:hypothetical protein BESB_076520 [Besnoitia besnoiti]|uniref:Uncharacterized protein n=1 Tax=Besnoitia besnoiti TaxID=94643 RepID=A0A2A9M641_BESBE|nr:hypothetical protein BESB_076520 [Besnoitia besnoiti]PFH33435.1 hypothetical protein BESB_076520 [Besnoitia besnoiti]
MESTRELSLAAKDFRDFNRGSRRAANLCLVTGLWQACAEARSAPEDESAVIRQTVADEVRSETKGRKRRVYSFSAAVGSFLCVCRGQASACRALLPAGFKPRSAKASAR